jgi:ADP-heptose:LPS heptosyltransferase
LKVSLGEPVQKNDHIVININSEASSRRLTPGKAIELLDLLRQSVNNKIYLVGAPKEKQYVDYVLSQLKDNRNMECIAGKTSLSELVSIIGSARLMLTTDSGPAHLSNALGTYTIVLFGAGNENHTAPYNKDLRTIIRLGQLSCEPCEKNVCVRYETPQCLERLDSMNIVNHVKTYSGN